MDMVVVFFAQRSEVKQRKVVFDFNSPTLCQIFPFLVPLKLGARQFLFQGNYDDGKGKHLSDLHHNHNEEKRKKVEKSRPSVIAYVTIT